MPSLSDLGQKVKAKYPQYANIDDAELGRKVKAKYPGAYQEFTDTPTQGPVGAAINVAAQATDKTLGAASRFLFGSTAKAAGGTIAGGIGAGMQLASQATGSTPLRAAGQRVQQAGEKGVTPFNIAMTPLEMWPGGGGEMIGKIPVVGPALEKAGGKLAGALKGSAEKQMTEALAPTTIKMKRTAEKVVPGMLERGVTAFTRKGLQAKAGGMLEKAGAALDAELATIPAKSRIPFRPVLKALEDAKNEFMVAGTKVAAEPKAIEAIDGIKKVITDVAKGHGDNVPFESMRSLRQIWDAAVARAKSGKGFLMDELGNFSLDAKKTGSNAIRKELATKFPNLAKVNAEYSFWKGVTDVVDATVERTASHGTPLGEKVATAAGVAGGMAAGGPAKAAEAGAVMKAIHGLANSTAWKTMSAVNKAKLAKAMMSGNAADVLALVARLGGDVSQIFQSSVPPGSQ